MSTAGKVLTRWKAEGINRFLGGLTPPTTSTACVVASGAFDPLHLGHIEHLEAASQLGPLLVVVNDDAFAKRKRLVDAFQPMPQSERCRVIAALACVTGVIPFKASSASDDTVAEALQKLRPAKFVCGGVWTHLNVPEAEVCRELGIEIVDSVGGRRR